MLAKVLAILEEQKRGETLDLVLLANGIVHCTVDLGNFGVGLGAG